MWVPIGSGSFFMGDSGWRDLREGMHILAPFPPPLLINTNRKLTIMLYLLQKQISFRVLTALLDAF